MAANWLRDLTRHHGMSLINLMENPLYQALDRRTASHLDTQLAAASWIDRLMGVKIPANATQVGGDHYRSRKIQHWDFAAGHDYGYLPGQATKYLFRWRDKNGLQDLQKCQHFLEKAIEVEGQHQDEGFIAPSILEFLRANDIPAEEQVIFILIHSFHETRNPEYLQEALSRVVGMVRANS